MSQNQQKLEIAWMVQYLIPIFTFSSSFASSNIQCLFKNSKKILKYKVYIKIRNVFRNAKSI